MTMASWPSQHDTCVKMQTGPDASHTGIRQASAVRSQGTVPESLIRTLFFARPRDGALGCGLSNAKLSCSDD